MAGHFITFEGTEGAGKSTQIQLLAERLRALGQSVSIFREPGGTVIGERLREIVKSPEFAGEISPTTELLLISASRAELIEQKIRPALEAGQVVLCDRFTDSTVAYQGYGRGLGLASIQNVVGFSVGGLVPDATLLLSVSLELSRSRRSSRESAGGAEGASDRFDQSGDAFFQRVEDGFAALAKAHPDRIREIDGDGSVEDIADRIWKSLASLGLEF